jgi:hypothetical protein
MSRECVLEYSRNTQLWENAVQTISSFISHPVTAFADMGQAIRRSPDSYSHSHAQWTDPVHHTPTRSASAALIAALGWSIGGEGRLFGFKKGRRNRDSAWKPERHGDRSAVSSLPCALSPSRALAQKRQPTVRQDHSSRRGRLPVVRISLSSVNYDCDEGYSDSKFQSISL